MSTKYFALLTQLGADKLANAAALGTKIEITHMAVGDGGGSLPTPDTKQTKLINEKRRAAINTLSIDPKNTNQIISEQVIPESEGGWWIREIGLFDKDGILIAVGNCAESYKPQLQEGSGRTQTIRMILIVSSTESVTLKVDPSVVLATREYVDDSIQKHSNSRNHPDATLKEKGFVILSSAVDSNSETHAATPKAVKAAYDFANAANNNANGRVPSGRKVNGKALSEDIHLKASDVDAYNKTETDARVNDAKAQAKAANDNADGRVPAGRKVNGKALNADIALNAEDVGAYNKGETDIRVNEAKALANARLEKNQNGADIPDKDVFNRNIGSGRAFSGAISIGGGGIWTTGEFIAWLKSQGAFQHPYWMCKGTWSYASNRRITDSGCGSIHLAGAVVEVMGIEDVMTIRVTTATTSVDGCIENALFTYGNHGKDYRPGWRRDYNTVNKPTADDVNAYNKSETDSRVNAANENANTRLEKNQNGADIPNKPKFVENLGLAETKNQAQNALPRSGGEVTGDITISTDSEISWRRNTDMAAIGFKNTGDGDTDSYMWFKTADNGNEYFKWQHSLSGGGTNEWMSLKSDNLRVKGHSVYHEGNKPTAGEVGAVSASGGVYNQSFDFKAINTQNLHLKYDKDKHNYISWYEDAERSAYLGFPSDNVKYFTIANEKLNSILTLHADSVTHNSRKLAFQDENYTKFESDNRFIRLNTSTKTSGYILSKTANYLEDTNARHLGRSGFLRPNGVDNLGSLAIHVAHPSVEKAQHSRGISFSYGSSGDDRFRISTYAFDENGKFQGQKRILTEDDLASTRNTIKKEPNGWWKCGDTGLIIQWGKWNNPYKTNDLGGHNGIPHGTNFTQNFAIPFSNMCFNIMPNITNSDTRDNINSPTIIIHSFDKNKFIFQTGEHWSIVQNSSIYWLAIGY
ncbi:phage tail protein [Xenorhabdus bovienii]|uniref:Uncharacterized protein n=1 Tax=Xenorhabdus bovienii str. Intermedium TaxID=1379677 RepID=A0A077QF37_XENBV|nr:phage tail protein [Xenorhabdus bovienii]CDH32049.1 hypothetical protein XBI1_1870015 [Xenorhabdus bovienii str. Intermedium]